MWDASWTKVNFVGRQLVYLSQSWFLLCKFLCNLLLDALYSTQACISLRLCERGEVACTQRRDILSKRLPT